MADTETHLLVCLIHFSPKLHLGATCRLRACSTYCIFIVTYIDLHIIINGVWHSKPADPVAQAGAPFWTD